MSTPRGSANNPQHGTITGTNLAIGSGNGKRSGNNIGSSIGARPFKTVKFDTGITRETGMPVTREFESVTRGARPPGGPNFNVRGQHPGTQRPGSSKGDGLRVKRSTNLQLSSNGGLISSMKLPNKIVRTTFGKWTNNELNYQLVLHMHNDSSRYDRMLSESMPVFRFLAQEEEDRESGMDVLVNLPTLNYILRSMSIENKTKTPYDILNQWGFMGVITRIVRNEADSVKGYIEAMEATLRIQGPILTLNVWGENVKPGTPLYFILKKVDNPPSAYVLDPSGQHSKRVQTQRKKLPRKSFQLIPYANDIHTRPPSNEVNYIDDDEAKSLKPGLRIYIGKAQYPPHVRNAYASASSAYNAHAMVIAAGQIWILLDPKIPV